MGFRFRRSIRLAPGIRLNLTSRGLSATVGPRGASINVGPRGTYANVGIPGTGLSSRTRIGHDAAPNHQRQFAAPVEDSEPAFPQPLAEPFAPTTRPVWPWILLGAVIGAALVLLFLA